jgi:hypothetical protein
MRNFRAILVGSVALAVITFGAGTLTSKKATLFFAAFWGAVIVLAIFRFGKRGLLLLLGTPLALYWPWVFMAFWLWNRRMGGQ